jgi:hypothetical protein
MQGHNQQWQNSVKEPRLSEQERNGIELSGNGEGQGRWEDGAAVAKKSGSRERARGIVWRWSEK